MKAQLNTDILSAVFEGIADTYSKLYKESAIWFAGVRIAPNDEVIVKGNILCKSENPTHKVIEMYGTLANTRFEVKALNLITMEEEIIKL